VVPFRPEKAARPSLRGLRRVWAPQAHDFSTPTVNNKSSCACQSLFERQPLGWEMGNEGRGSRQISSSHRLWPLWWVVWAAATQLKRKKLIFLLIFVPVNSKCLHSFINVSKIHAHHGQQYVLVSHPNPQKLNPH